MPVTEAMCLLDFSTAAQGALLEFIERGVLQILDITTRDLPAIHSLMKKYSDQATCRGGIGAEPNYSAQRLMSIRPLYAKARYKECKIGHYY